MGRMSKMSYLNIQLGNGRYLDSLLKDKADRSPMNTLMSIPQKRQFLDNFRVIYI